MSSPVPPDSDDRTGNAAAAEARSKRIIWALVAVAVVALVALFLWRLSAPASADPRQVEAALAKQAALFAGTGEPAALAKASCESAGDDEYLCTPNGASEKQGVRIVLAADGSISERLAGSTAATDLRSSDGVANALAADAKQRGLGTPDYACGTSIRMTPEGGTEPGNAVGFLCAAKRGASSSTPAEGSTTGTRYLETTADGTLSRDYAIRTK